MPPDSSKDCEFIAISFMKLMDEIRKNSDYGRYSKRGLPPFYIGKMEMLVEIALRFPISPAEVDKIIRSISYPLQETGKLELLVPLAAEKGSLGMRKFLYNVLLEPKVTFPMFQHELIPLLERLVGSKLDGCDLTRVRDASIGEDDYLESYRTQMI